MHVFKDTTGRTWTIAVTAAAVKRCRAKVDVDLPGLADDGFKGFGALMGDLIKLVDVLYVLCEAEANARNVGDVEFGEAMAGDAILEAAHAFGAELVDFFPDARRREAFRRVIDAGYRITDLMLERATAELDAIDVDTILASLTASSTASPASSASTPGPSPGAN